MPQSVLDRKITGMQKLRQSQSIGKINDFMESPWFIGVVCGLILVCNLLGAELIVYPVLVLFGVYMAAFGRDFLPLTAIAACCYMGPSVHNNPGQNPDSVLYPEKGGWVLAVVLAVLILATVLRLCLDRQLGKGFLRCRRSLMSGMVILGVAYLLAGAFSGRYFENGIWNLVFALLQFVSVAGFYWFFTGAVRWERVHPDYFLWVGLGAGLMVSGQIIGVVLGNNVIEDSQIVTPMIFTGWGNANNMGCMAAMMIPCAVGLARRTGKVTLFCLLAILIAVCVCLTCSRTSMAAAALIYVLSVAVSLRDRRCRKKLLIFHGIAALALAVALFVMREELRTLFDALVDRGLDPRMRDIIYPEGIRTFRENPVFGEGFYPSTDKIYEWSKQERLKAILPARWHNTVIQLLASCGVVGLLAYGNHRQHTIRLFWEKRKTPAIYIGLSLLAMLLMSLLDCHFFNIGPTLVYSIGLAFAEKTQWENRRYE